MTRSDDHDPPPVDKLPILLVTCHLKIVEGHPILTDKPHGIE